MGSLQAEEPDGMQATARQCVDSNHHSEQSLRSMDLNHDAESVIGNGVVVDLDRDYNKVGHPSRV